MEKEVVKYTQTPHNLPMSACVFLYCRARPGEIVVVRRRQDPSKVGLAGGKIQEGETLWDALSRETREEIGIVLDWQKARPLFIDICEDDNNIQDYWNTCFYLEIEDPHIVFPSEEPELDPHWVSVEEFLKRSAFPRFNGKMIAQARKLGII